MYLCVQTILCVRVSPSSPYQETQLPRLENEMAAVTLESSDVTLRLEGLARTLASLETEMSRRNKLLSASEARITKCVTVIERKQATINVYNKKIEQLIASTGVRVNLQPSTDQ